MDEDAREVRRGGELIELTATEFELLRFLMRNPRRVLSKAQILDRVWNYDFGGQAHVVELYISYLRKKIDAGRPPMIHTVRGVGYVLKPRQPDGRDDPRHGLRIGRKPARGEPWPDGWPGRTLRARLIAGLLALLVAGLRRGRRGHMLALHAVPAGQRLDQQVSQASVRYARLPAPAAGGRPAATGTTRQAAARQPGRRAPAAGGGHVQRGSPAATAAMLRRQAVADAGRYRA